jgi:hypothetical protein
MVARPVPEKCVRLASSLWRSQRNITPDAALLADSSSISKTPVDNTFSSEIRVIRAVSLVALRRESGLKQASLNIYAQSDFSFYRPKPE